MVQLRRNIIPFFVLVLVIIVVELISQFAWSFIHHHHHQQYMMMIRLIRYSRYCGVVVERKNALTSLNIILVRTSCCKLCVYSVGAIIFAEFKILDSQRVRVEREIWGKRDIVLCNSSSVSQTRNGYANINDVFLHSKYIVTDITCVVARLASRFIYLRWLRILYKLDSTTHDRAVARQKFCSIATSQSIEKVVELGEGAKITNSHSSNITWSNRTLEKIKNDKPQDKQSLVFCV